MKPLDANSVQAVFLAFAEQRWKDVIALASETIEFSQDVEPLRMVAIACSELGDRNRAQQLLKRALTIDPHSPVLRVSQALVLKRGGDLAAAKLLLHEAIELDPKLTAAHYNLGNLLKSEARLAEARPHLENAIALSPNHVNARVVLGEVLKALGDIQGAVDQFRAAIKLRPDMGPAWWGIANLKTAALTKDDLHQLDSLWLQTTNRSLRETIGFARASAHARHGATKLGWDALLEANQFVAAARKFDDVAFQSDMQRANNSLLTLTHRDDQTTVDTLFIVGMPRSGSTLLEQMLAGHSALSPASELPDLLVLVSQQARQAGENWRNVFREADWQELGRKYLLRTQRWRAQKPILIDKQPVNFKFVDVILKMHAGARIIDCRRDARDTALSCLQQYFAWGNEFSFDLNSIAKYNAEYRDLMDHARRVAPDKITLVQYEELIQYPERVMQSVLHFLGLPFEQSCLSPELVRREVRTASAAQVIEPLNQRGIGRWQHYPEPFESWNEFGARNL